MTPELAVKLLPIFMGTVALFVTAGALIAGDMRLAATGAVCLVIAVGSGFVMQIQSEIDRPDEPDDCH